MTTTMAITLVITVIMAVLFLWGKFPFGLVTMSCMLAMVVTGVLSLSEGFAGLTNTSVILVASMFAMTAALQKTDVPYYMTRLITKLEGKSDYLLMGAIIIVFLITSTVLPGEMVTLLVISFVALLPEGSEVTPGRIVMPCLMLGACWAFAVPVGLGATVDYTANVYMEGIVTDSSQFFVLGNMFSMRIIPTIVVALYCLFIWKRLPKNHEINMDNVTAGEVRRSPLPQWKQILVYFSFIAVIFVMLFSSKFGMLMYYLPAIFVCIYGFTGILSAKEIVNGVACDTVWMLVGILGVSAGLTASGAVTLLGNLLVPLVSWTDNGFLILLLVGGFTALMTTFLSNTGTVGVMSPLAASVAVAAGMDPRSLVAAVTINAMYAFCFPSGSTTCAFAYALGKYNPIKSLKYTVPLLILVVVATAFSISLIFPPFG